MGVAIDEPGKHRDVAEIDHPHFERSGFGYIGRRADLFHLVALDQDGLIFPHGSGAGIDPMCGLDHDQGCRG